LKIARDRGKCEVLRKARKPPQRERGRRREGMDRIMREVYMRKGITIIMIFGFLVVSCGGYTTPSEDFLKSAIQFDEPGLTKKNVTVEGFVDALKGLKSGDQETIIQGWRQNDDTWVLVCESAGEKYEYRFTDVMTNKNGKSMVVFQSIQRDGKYQEHGTLLHLIIK
jgi:hypothetical protein